MIFHNQKCIPHLQIHSSSDSVSTFCIVSAPELLHKSRHPNHQRSSTQKLPAIQVQDSTTRAQKRKLGRVYPDSKDVN